MSIRKNASDNSYIAFDVWKNCGLGFVVEMISDMQIFRDAVYDY